MLSKAALHQHPRSHQTQSQKQCFEYLYTIKAPDTPIVRPEMPTIIAQEGSSIERISPTGEQETSTRTNRIEYSWYDGKSRSCCRSKQCNCSIRRNSRIELTSTTYSTDGLIAESVSFFDDKVGKPTVVHAGITEADKTNKQELRPRPVQPLDPVHLPSI